MIYLDYAANHPVETAVLERFCQTELHFYGNPNSSHPAGHAALEEQTRITDSVAELLDAEPEEIIFTSGATEANNLAIKGICHSTRHLGRHIISTPLEHSSVSGTLTYLQEKGYEIDLLPIQRDGTFDLQELNALLRPDTVLVAVTATDSELGVIQPIAAVKDALAGYPNCHLHVDATQAIGRIPFSFSGLDTMSLAAHKFGGLNGSGILLKRKGIAIEPQMHGGASTTLYRSGTPTLALNASTELALRMALQTRQEHWDYVQALNVYLRKELDLRKCVHINSPANSVPYILNLSVEGIRGAEFQQKLANLGVCVSVKSACSVDNTPSRAVFAVTRNRKTALSSWRISLSWRTQPDELKTFLQLLDQCLSQQNETR